MLARVRLDRSELSSNVVFFCIVHTPCLYLHMKIWLGIQPGLPPDCWRSPGCRASLAGYRQYNEKNHSKIAHISHMGSSSQPDYRQSSASSGSPAGCYIHNLHWLSAPGYPGAGLACRFYSSVSHSPIHAISTADVLVNIIDFFSVVHIVVVPALLKELFVLILVSAL